MDGQHVILLVGDMHIPYRAYDIPTAFKALLNPERIQHIVCTGNIVNDAALDILKSISPDIIGCRGQYDEIFLPENGIRSFGNIKICAVAGHQVVPFNDPEGLASIAERLDADILIAGGSPTPSVTIASGKVIIHPGSITGVLGDSFVSKPSFAVLMLNPNASKEATVFFYTLENDENIKLENIKFTIP